MTIGAVAYKQTATYWGAPVQNGFGGNTFSAPVELACRWENVTERFMDSDGVEGISNAKVWTFDPLDVGGYLFLGSSVAADPTTVNKAYMIRRCDEIPDLRLLHYERISYL